MSFTSFRESLASIPGALSNFINENAPSYLNSSLSISTPSSMTDEGSDKSMPIPASLIKEQWQLIFNSDSTIPNVEEAIKKCRELVLTTEECSEERKWLVRHLVDLRFSLKELQDAELDPNEAGPTIKTVIGHHFTLCEIGKSLQNTPNYCDHCTGIIWSVVQSSYVCCDCKFRVHQKCIDNIIRVCAHVVASDRKYPIGDICPEIGLAAQFYKCAECKAPLNFNLPSSVKCFGQKFKEEKSWVEPRLCDYSGLYYCLTCHWNDSIMIPARIIHNWDFAKRKVCRASLQEIELFLEKPLIKLELANPKLFVFLQSLCNVKKLRQNLVFMRKYLLKCRQATEDKLLESQIGSRRHLIQSIEYYSIIDMEQSESNELAEFLNKVYNIFDAHIRNCVICTAKAYICEICGNNEVIYPFDDGCICCDKCNSIYHRVCMTRKNMICPKCVRLQERKSLQNNSESDEE